MGASNSHKDFLLELFTAKTAGKDKFTRRMAIEMADMLHCEVRPLIRRLEARGLLKKGSWDWFVSNGGFTKANYVEARKSPTPEAK